MSPRALSFGEKFFLERFLRKINYLRLALGKKSFSPIFKGVDLPKLKSELDLNATYFKVASTNWF